MHNTETLTLFGGAFKPPTRGHFNIVKWVLDNNPNTKEVRVYVGEGERGGVSQSQSIFIWNIYKKYLHPKVTIIPIKAPIREIHKIAMENPNQKINMVIGYRLDNEKDLMDVGKRTKNLPLNVDVSIHTSRDEGLSGTQARKSFRESKESLIKCLPKELSDTEVSSIFNLLNNKMPQKIDNKIWI
tara:strand:- start:5726 stop:6280 length:555 start_codon:yes stop_codon:yes gene_type:complete